MKGKENTHSSENCFTVLTKPVVMTEKNGWLYNEAPVNRRVTERLVWYGSLVLQVSTRTRTSPSVQHLVNPDGSYWGGKYRRGPDKIKISGADKGKVAYWWSRPQLADTRYLLFKTVVLLAHGFAAATVILFLFLFSTLCLSLKVHPPCCVKLRPPFTVCQTDKYCHPYNQFCGLLQVSFPALWISSLEKMEFQATPDYKSTIEYLLVQFTLRSKIQWSMRHAEP